MIVWFSFCVRVRLCECVCVWVEGNSDSEPASFILRWNGFNFAVHLCIRKRNDPLPVLLINRRRNRIALRVRDDPNENFELWLRRIATATSRDKFKSIRCQSVNWYEPKPTESERWSPLVIQHDIVYCLLMIVADFVWFRRDSLAQTDNEWVQACDWMRASVDYLLNRFSDQMQMTT